MATWSTEPLPEAARAAVDGLSFATVATLEPDGSPHTSVVWITRDDDTLVFSTVLGRRKTTNMQRDPRVSLLVMHPDRPYSYLEVRGEVSMTEQGGRALIDTLAAKYRGLDRYPWDDGTDNVRVVCRVTAHKVVWHG
jgi:PPOX class probable F420-dependent enzyme